MSRGPTNFFDRPGAPEPEDDLAPTPSDAPREVRTTPRALYRWFEKFGISEGTVYSFGCYVVEHAFPAAGKDIPAGTFQAIAIPHRLGGKEVNRRLRPPKGKPEIVADPAMPTAFNIEGIETPDVVWVAETELEAMALVDGGYPQTIAIMDGGAVSAKEKRFPALETHATLLNSVKQFVLCASNTDFGFAWREALAARLGRHRCLIVEWPSDSLGPSDLLASPSGADALQAAVNAAVLYPIEGLQRFGGEVLIDLLRRPRVPVMTGGVQTLDDIGLRFPSDGRLITLTGIPNSGKSVVMRFWMIHLMLHFNRRFAVFSPEMSPWERFVAEAATVLNGKQFWPRRGFPPDRIMTADDMRRDGAWLGERLTMLTVDGMSTSPSLDWLLEMLTIAVLRDGITDAVVDPWNNLRHDFKGLTEATYINDALLACLGFCHRHGVNMWIVVHPKTQTPPKPGGKLLAPGAYEINGGAAWANHTDLGLTIHRPDSLTEVHVWKSKRREWGEWRTMASMKYDRDTGRFTMPPDAAPFQKGMDF